MITRSLENILVTGGAGFIGSNLINHIFTGTAFTGRIVNLGLLTYAGNPLNLEEVETRFGGRRYFFEKGDIRDKKKVKDVLEKYDIDTVINLAAESHVDRPIVDPEAFITTNINGTFTLLEAVRVYWKNPNGKLFHHISTDEVYGSLGAEGFFSETTKYDPRSPYSAAKAASDHLVSSYRHTYGLPVTISNCSNNYGPYQFPEKLIPLMIENMLEGKALPVYGDGRNIRDWIFVDDHNSAVWKIIKNAENGSAYNIGGENEWENIRLVNKLCEITSKITGQDENSLKKLIKYVKDRPGHDRRYAIDCSRIKKELGWERKNTFEEGLEKTVKWYITNRKWVESVRTGEYKLWINENYGDR